MGWEIMRAAIQLGPGRYEIRDVPVPEITDAQCLIKVGACTLCGTDVKYFKGQVDWDWPSPMGHEVAGTIERVGRSVEGFKRGDRVVSRMAWGGFAEYVASEADLLAPLPDHVGFEEGAIAQLLPIAVRGAEMLVTPGQSVLVSGLGGAGLLCVQAVKAHGAARVVGTDLFELRRSVALEVGADVVVDPSAEDIAERVRAETSVGVDVAIDAVGVEPSFRACERSVCTGGVIGVFGTHLQPLELDMRDWERGCRRLVMMGEPAEEKPAMLRKAIELVASGKVRLEPLLSRVMGLDEIMDAFDKFINHPDRHIKIAIVP